MPDSDQKERALNPVLQEAARAMFEAKQSNAPKALVSQFIDNLDETSAYLIQKEFVRLSAATDRISGFKAALTNEGAQTMFKTQSAASGVLFSSGQLSSDQLSSDQLSSDQESAACELNLADFGLAVIEMEIGFCMAKKISCRDKPVSLKMIKESVAVILPIIEIPDLAFDGRVSNALDLIAANSVSSAYIVGQEGEVSQNLNDIQVSLSFEGEQIGQGKGCDAMGDQWSALYWLVNQVLAQGYDIEAGSYLITGSLGGISAAKLGEYCADYGDFGRIAFRFT